MKTKVTLTLDKDLVEEVKKILKAQGKTLSQVLEEYLRELIAEKRKLS